MKGQNYGFAKVSELGGELADAADSLDIKNARKIVQKRQDYLAALH